MFISSFMPSLIKLFPFFGGMVEVKVSTSELYNAANEAYDKAQQTKNKFENIKQAMSSTQTYWNGKVSDKERKIISDEYDEMMDFIKMLIMYSDSLKQMAKNYETAEDTNEEMAQGLPTDIIM